MSRREEQEQEDLSNWLALVLACFALAFVFFAWFS